MLRISHDTLSIGLFFHEKCLAKLPGHFFMPRGISAPSFFGHRQVPFGICGYPRPALGIFRLRVYHFDVSLERLVEEIVGIGILQPFAHAWRVWEHAL
jgi:hypothetical protein